MKCVLKDYCKFYKSEKCNSSCSSFINMHGHSGKSGRVSAAAVPEEYRRLNLKDNPIQLSQEGVYSVIEAYAKTFDRQFGDGKVKSLYLWSRSPGNGKTSTAAVLLNEWIIAHYIGCLKRNRQADMRPAFFLDVNDWQTFYNGFARNNIPSDIAEPNSREYYRRLDIAKKTPFVILDDIGVRDCTEGFRGDLHSLINARVTNKLPTIYTSNIPLEELPKVFKEQRLYDRMRDLCIPIEFNGESKRGMRKNG